LVSPAGRAARNAAKVGDPLPHIDVLEPLYSEGVEFYRGSLTMIAGLPGAQKSMFAMWYAQQLNIPTLYFSADSDAATMTSRMASAVSDTDSGTIRNEYMNDTRREYYADLLAASNICFCFDSAPGVGDIGDELDAYITLFGRLPELIVIDNLMDVYSGAEAEHVGNKSTLKDLKELARVSGAAVFVLHHMSEANTDPAYPAPRSALQGKVSQTPALVLSLAVEGDAFRISVVKNRNGKATPNAMDYYTLLTDPAHATFKPKPWRPYTMVEGR
jgi:hypothetical protein